MKNPSGLEARGRAVLVKEYNPEIKDSIIAIPEDARQRIQMLEQRAFVVDIGPNAWHDEPTPRAKVGEMVLVSKYSGFIARAPLTADGQEYRLVNDRDIFAAFSNGADNG